EVASLIKTANPHVTKISIYLAVTAGAVGSADRAAKSVTEEYWGSLGEERWRATADHRAIEGLIMYTQAQDSAEYNKRIAQDKAAERVFTKIGVDHDALARHADDLSGQEVKAVIAKDLPIFRAAFALFQQR